MTQQQVQVFNDNLILPVVQDVQILGAAPTFDQPRNGAYDRMRSQLHVAPSVVGTTSVIDTVDVTDVENATGRGISIQDQRLGVARYPVGLRSCTVQGGAQNLSFTTFTGPLVLNFDTVVVEGLGITNAAYFPTSGTTVTNFALPDTGIYMLSTKISLDTQASTPDVIMAFRLETRRSDVIDEVPPESEIVSSLEIARLPNAAPQTYQVQGAQLFTMPTPVVPPLAAYPDGTVISPPITVTQTNQFFVQINPLDVPPVAPPPVVPVLSVQVTVTMLSAL